MKLEIFWKEMISGKGYCGVKTVLKGMSYGYRALISLRHLAYDRHWLKTVKVSIPIVSVGNIAVGGTGKTPLVCLLAQEFSKDIKIAILSRGYCSKIEKSKEVVSLSEFSLTPEECGDEPYFLKQHLPEAMIFVGKNRSQAAVKAIQKGAKLILLDDGMQHRRLGRTLEIVVVDAKDPLGQGYFLPRGFLRDHPKRLASADLIIANHLEEVADYERVKGMLSTYTKAPLVGMQLVSEEEGLREKKLGLFCAIGSPNRFKETVERLGGKVMDELLAPDHQPFSKKCLEAFARNCQLKGAELLVCTEKDWVKLPRDLKPCLPINPIKVRLMAVVGKEHWQTFIEKIKTQVET